MPRPKPRPVLDVAPAIVSYPLRRYLLDDSRGKARAYKPHIYGAVFLNPAALAVGATMIDTVDLDSDAPFLWTRTLEVDNEAESTRFTFNGLVQIRIGGPGGRAMARTDTHIACCTGKRPTPRDLPAPALLDAGTQIHVTLTNLQAGQSTSGELWIMFMGMKVYGWGPAQ